MADLREITHFSGGIKEKKGTGAATNATVTVDLATGNFFEIDLQDSNADIGTFTISNAVPSASATYIGISFVLKITQGSTARQFTWSSFGSSPKLRWTDETAGPTLTKTNNAVDILSFFSYDRGVTWWSSAVGFNFL